MDVSEQPGVAEVFPRSRTLARYNDLYAANRFTSANSTIVYRDDLLGPAFEGNSFVSEPVHNLVHREIMCPDGLAFHSRRADDERSSEFLASADNWFRPATLVAGPDGALWVADMYRQTIEHPQWIPQTIQDQVDLRAGSDMGRIYRVYPVGATPRTIPRLDKLSTAELVAALDSPSGWQRDMVQQMLFWRDDKSAIEPLRKLAAQTRATHLPRPGACGPWSCSAVPRPRTSPRHGRRASRRAAPGGARSPKRHLAESPRTGRSSILALADDADLHVQLQRAYTLGEWNDPRAGDGARRALHSAFDDNPYITAAVLSSVNQRESRRRDQARARRGSRPPSRRPSCSNNSWAWPAP